MVEENITVVPESEWEVVAYVTRQHLKMEVDKPYILKFEGAFYEAEDSKPVRTPRKSKHNADGQEATPPASTRNMAPPLLADATNVGVTPNFPCTIIVNAVLEAELLKKYPDNGYVSKVFRIVRKQLQGRRYATFEVQEMKKKVAAPAQETQIAASAAPPAPAAPKAPEAPPAPAKQAAKK